MLWKENGKEDTVLVFMQNNKFCFRMQCQTFPKIIWVAWVEAFPRVMIPRFRDPLQVSSFKSKALSCGIHAGAKHSAIIRFFYSLFYHIRQCCALNPLRKLH